MVFGNPRYFCGEYEGGGENDDGADVDGDGGDGGDDGGAQRSGGTDCLFLNGNGKPVKRNCDFVEQNNKG